MNALHRSIIACLVFIFLISGTIPSIWASVSFTGYLPLSGDPVNPIYDFEKSFYIHYPQGSKLQSILQNKNVTISFTEDANNNTDVKTLMDEINNYISTKGHSAATMSNLVVDYKLLVTGYADHASFDYTLVLTPTVTNYMLNKPTDGIPETLDASWMAFSITSPVAIYTKQYGPIEINSPLSVIQSQLPDVYNEIKGTDASQIFTYAMLDTTKLFDQQPLNKWDSLFDPAYTLTETAGYGFKEQKVAVTTYSSGLSNAFSGTLSVNNVDEDFAGNTGAKYHITTSDHADAGTINVEGHANVNQIQNGWTFVTTTVASSTISTTTAGGLSTMTIYAVAGFAATLGATLFWWSTKSRKVKLPDDVTSSARENNLHATITIDGLKKTYHLGEPIEFTVSIKGYDNGVYPFISIAKEPEGEKIWSQGYMTQEPANSPPFDVDMTLHVPSNENKIDAAARGIYTVSVSITHNAAKESFEVV